MKYRFRRNGIMALNFGDILIEDVNGIKTLVFEHFKHKYKESSFRRPRLEEVPFKQFPKKIALVFKALSLSRISKKLFGP